MSLQIYRIDRSLCGRTNNRFKKPALPAASSAFLSIGLPLKNVLDFLRKESYVLSEDDEINRFQEAFGAEWKEDFYYIRHPQPIKTSTLIPADRFHEYVVREQISDIASYIRSNLNIKEMSIKIKSSSGASVDAGGIFNHLPMEGGASVSIGKDYSAKIVCERALKASEKKTVYTWIDNFPHLLSIIDDADHGDYEIEEKVDLSFGLSAKAAKFIGVSLAWHNEHRFFISIKV